MLENWLRRRRPPDIATAVEFAAFLEGNAWQIAQRSVIGYCTVKTMLPVHELLVEAEFAAAYDIAIWESYAAVLADLAIVGHGYLGPHGRALALAEGLAGVYAGLLAAHPRPAHRTDGWADAENRLRARLTESAVAPPRPIRDIALTSARRIADTLPIHARLRAPDEPAVIANVQFLMVGLAHEFEKRIDLKAVATELLHRAGPAAPSPA